MRECVCARARAKGCMQGMVWMNQITRQSMLQMMGQVQYVEGGVAGCCRVRHSVYWRERLQGWTGINPGCSKTEQLGHDKAWEARKDGIRGREKPASGREGPTQTSNPPW